MSFGPATLDDLVPISELLLRAIPNCVPQTVDQLRERKAETWVARQSDGAVLASASLVRIAGGRWELRGVIVDPSVRGQGVGQRLVAQLLSSGPRSGDEVCCVTRQPQFFRRLGFQPLGTPWETGQASSGGRKRIAMGRRMGRRLP